MNEVVQCKRFKLIDPPKAALKISGNRIVTLAGNIPVFAGFREGQEVTVVDHATFKKLCNDAFMWRSCGAIG